MSSMYLLHCHIMREGLAYSLSHMGNQQMDFRNITEYYSKCNFHTM